MHSGECQFFLTTSSACFNYYYYTDLDKHVPDKRKALRKKKQLQKNYADYSSFSYSHRGETLYLGHSWSMIFGIIQGERKDKKDTAVA